MLKGKYQCDLCNKNAKLKDVWGCVYDTQLYDGTTEEVENGIKYVYWNCPRKFIPRSIFEFLVLHQYYENHSSSPFPSIDNISARYLFAENYYRNKLRENTILSQRNGGDLNGR